MGHGGNVDTLVSQDHEGQWDVEGNCGTDQRVRPVDQKHTTCVVGASYRRSPLLNLEKKKYKSYGARVKKGLRYSSTKAGGKGKLLVGPNCKKKLSTHSTTYNMIVRQI